MQSFDLKSRKRLLIYVNLLVDSVGWSLAYPALPDIYARLNVSYLEIGVISAILAFVIFVFGILQGPAADYFGRIRMLQLSAGTQFIGHCMVIYALHRKSIFLFTLARCLPAVFKCGMVVSQALLFDISTESDVSRNIATLMTYSNISFVVGPIIGGEVYSLHPLLPFYMGIAVSMLNLSLLTYLEQLLKLQCSVKSGDSEPAEKIVLNESDSTGDNNSINKSVTTQQQSECTVMSTSGVTNSKQQINQPVINNSSSNNNNKSNKLRHLNSSDAKDGPEVDKSFTHLLQYLHIRFSFQLSNSLLEALFAQHSRNTLHISGSVIGRLMAVWSVLSAFTNAVLLKRLLARNRNPERFLFILAVAMTGGLYGWVLSTTVWCMALSVSLTSVCSNLFLNIMQSIIAESQKAIEQRRKRTEEGEEEEEELLRCSQSLSASIVSYPHDFGSSSCKKEENVVASEGKVALGPSNDDKGASPAAPAAPAVLRPQPAVSATPTRSSISTIFGMSSSIDRAARIISPMAGGVFIEYFGNMGLLFIISMFMLYCIVLVVFFLPVRNDKAVAASSHGGCVSTGGVAAKSKDDTEGRKIAKVD